MGVQYDSVISANWVPMRESDLLKPMPSSVTAPSQARAIDLSASASCEYSLSTLTQELKLTTKGLGHKLLELLQSLRILFYAG